MKNYHINLFWSDEDQAWIADIPDLETCSAIGATPEAALAELIAARNDWLEVAQEQNLRIPEAIYRAPPAGRS